MNRRTFIKGALAGAAALMVPVRLAFGDRRRTWPKVEYTVDNRVFVPINEFADRMRAEFNKAGSYLIPTDSSLPSFWPGGYDTQVETWNSVGASRARLFFMRPGRPDEPEADPADRMVVLDSMVTYRGESTWFVDISSPERRSHWYHIADEPHTVKRLWIDGEEAGV